MKRKDFAKIRALKHLAAKMQIQVKDQNVFPRDHHIMHDL
eukprot:CAMPEP_0197070668 /NCGR_PEP_ID=MMETSP1384-20130603/201754_1 /TAXON_ID=29189 /ORGANISM="Ammonia sp." /LENGTH=39 /DNA_ID= /DNA_START= /DNA_END= /DNA_ORIENTATION=